MEELVKAVEKLSEKDCIDYLTVFVPIFISILAVIISIYTARKQNKIALFEMRYKALSQLQTLIRFEEGIYDKTSPEVIINLFDMFFKTDIRSQDTIMALITSAQKIQNIKNDVSAMFLIENGNYDDLFEQTLKNATAIIVDAINGSINQAAKNNLHKCCAGLNTHVYSKLIKKIKL